jgi:hypothetical protein
MSEEQRRETAEKFRIMAAPMRNIEFTAENYKKLFPNGMVKTPLGEVKIGENQFKKLESKDYGGRQNLLGAMHQTLNDPVLVIEQTRKQDNGKKSYLYVKSFTKKNGKYYSIVISVVVAQKEGRNPLKVSITTHRRDMKDVIKTIKNPESIVYEKTNTSGQNSGDHDVNSSNSNEQHTTF